MKNRSMLTILILGGGAIISFILSIFAIIFKVIALIFLTALLGLLTIWSFKKYRENKMDSSPTTIDELLQENNYKVQKSHKKSFVQKSENFSNGLVPFALAFITFCSFCVLIFMLIK